MTAQRGAGPRQPRGATTKDASDIKEAATSPQDTDFADEVEEDFRGENEEMRRQFVQCNLRIQEAEAAGDQEALERAREDKRRIGDAFAKKNTRFVVSKAARYLIGHRENREDHLGAAYLGFWESFVGTDANLIDKVVVDENGQVHAVTGWDPTKGTFTTFAGQAISGKVLRSVREVEGAFTGIKYHTFGQKPQVDLARRNLTVSLGRSPTVAEIAAEAKVTEETVRVCSSGAPVSLQMLVTDDGSTTLEDRLSAELADEGVDLSGVDEDELLALVSQLTALDLLVLALRTGMPGGSPLTVVRTADKLCVGRGAAQLAIKRAVALLIPQPEIPAKVRCESCKEELAYDAKSEPVLTLTEFDVPADAEDLTISQYRELMAAETARVNAAQQAEQAAYEEALTEYRRAAREAAEQFTAEHRPHGAASAAADLAAMLATEA